LDTLRRIIPIGLFLVLVASALGDHYFRDEFYYLACSHRLDWGYVDHPPLSVALLWLVRHAAGDSLLTLRVTAAIVAAASVWVTGSIARRLGASAFGETVAMLGVAIAPELLSSGTFYSMNVFDVLIWTLAARLFAEILDQPSTGRWILLGVVLGLGLENKISVLWLGGGLAAGLVLMPARRLLLTPGPWIAAAIAGALFAPHVIWQVTHGWPTLEFIRNASRDKMQANTPLAFLATQVLNMNPLTLPVWLGGLLYLLLAPAAARYRPLGIAFLTVAAILILNRTSRSGYLAPAYPMLFAAGGVAVERFIAHRAWRAGLVAVLLLGRSLLAPFAVPLLSVDRYVRYSRALGISPTTEEKKDVGRLPQFFADRQGWDRFVDQIAAAFERLSPSERASAAVLVGNYGEAGAIELLGRSRGLTAISGHNNYWTWGPRGRTGDVLIVVSRSRERQEQRFASVEKVGEIDCGDCMPYENGLSIFIGRGLKPPSLSERWPSFKHYD
jgi:Dolichyl-phosphate-mannose-protein mannosyltransferase